MDIEKIKKLRSQTGISIMKCRSALKESGGDLEKAKQILKQKGLKVAEEKRRREAGTGIIHCYIHNNKKIGVLLDLRSETDFVARNKEFQELAHQISMHIAAMNPEGRENLLNQPWIKNEKKTIKGLISEYIAKLGENIVINRFVRYEV